MEKEEIIRSVGEQLETATWASAFKERTNARNLRLVWIVHPAADRVDAPWIYANSSGHVLHVDFASPAHRISRILVLLLLLAGLALLVSRYYPKQWCGYQMVAKGNPQRICRDPEVTDPPIVALGLIVLAALGVFYTEISGFGVTLKRDIRKVRTDWRRSISEIAVLQKDRGLHQVTLQDFGEANERTNSRLTNLENQINNINRNLYTSGPAGDGRGHEEREPIEPPATAIPAEPGPPLTTPSSSAGSSTDDGSQVGRTGPSADGLNADEVLRLADEYNISRSTMVAGPARSTRMEEIFRKMRSAVKSIQVSYSGVEGALFNPDKDRGIKLTAYAYLIENPNLDVITLLVKAAEAEDKPFGQLCALRAVNKLVQTSSTQLLTPELLTILNKIAIKAGPGTDRAHEVTGILAEHQVKQPSGNN